MVVLYHFTFCFQSSSEGAPSNTCKSLLSVGYSNNTDRYVCEVLGRVYKDFPVGCPTKATRIRNFGR